MRMKYGWLLVVLISATVSGAAPVNLIDAVKAGDAQAVRAMLKQRANVNATELLDDVLTMLLCRNLLTQLHAHRTCTIDLYLNR